MKKVSIIVAVDDKNGIWKNNDLAWDISSDRKYFKKITISSLEGKKNSVIMWRKTWDSIPEKFKPLPNRINCILSSKHIFEDKNGEIRKFWSFESALQNLSLDEKVDKIFVIWGWCLYNKVFSSKHLESIYKTKVFWDFGCDIFIDEIPSNFKLISKTKEKYENEIKFIFEVYKNTNK